MEDIRHNKNGKFVTLTFTAEAIAELMDKIMTETEGVIDEDEGGYELDNMIATRAVRWFLERWRKKYKKSVRHWLITELGHEQTERIHLHGIIWTDESMDEIEKIWKYGWVWKGKGEKMENYVNEETVNYLIKYVTKMDHEHPNYMSKVLTSAGMGKGYMNRQDSQRNKYKEDGTTKEKYRLRTGAEVNLPIYWRNKIYTEEQREKLWIEKIERNERWICGVKVQADHHEAVMRLLEVFRERNLKLGYGSDEVTWQQEEYENKMRQLKRQEQRRKL